MIIILALKLLYKDLETRIIMPSFKCQDMGYRCTFEVSAANMDELMQKIITHSRETHKMKNIPHDKIAKIKKVIRE